MNSERIAQRILQVRKALYGEQSNAAENRLRTKCRALREKPGEWERVRTGIHRAVVEQAFADYTLVPLVWGRFAHSRDHGPLVWFALEQAYLVMVNPSFGSHAAMLRDLDGPEDNPYGMMLRCVEWLKLPS